jgi:hypothetical protein
MLNSDCGGFERVARSMDSGNRSELALDHCIENVGGIPAIDLGITRTWSLCLSDVFRLACVLGLNTLLGHRIFCVPRHR